MTMEETACDAWKKCTLEMVNLISSNSKPAMKDYHSLLIDNMDLRKQNEMALAALESALSDKEVSILKYCEFTNNNKEMSKIRSGKCSETVNDEKLIIKNRDIKEEKSLTPIRENIDMSKLAELNCSVQLVTDNDVLNSYADSHPSSNCSNSAQKGQEFYCPDCLKSQFSLKLNVQTSELTQFKEELDQANELNKNLSEELKIKKKENEELKDQIISLEVTIKALTEAINLQDEQLSEYGSLVASLKKSRSQIIERMKEASARNSYNVMIMANIEQEVEQLRMQLDAYNDLLVNQQNIHQIDKASCTELTEGEMNSNEEMLKKKDNYIALLQDRLCEAIVDLKNKDSEIKNHTNSVKALINNYETEKKCLEDRLRSANVSAEKMEENKIKQQETMKQLMKLIEFLQGKLEKIHRK